ncbi:acyl-CoA acyltransferase [Deinococcus sp. KNUC1210]|uniref:acyl-CoA acyltransferase n=1 Tax=Deinococcus sp. KNUC1210 TaxID=2917691 RepID=UPI001EEF8773|nr:acyl-CoA acyltransferase [Deinococcus sp. KNUC1210]ULH14806.1 acyl-CoA acyltransferase [Deinococcus sp. KNUC1210]
MARPFLIRDVTSPPDMHALEDVQIAAWGYPEREVLPSSMFRISAATGGVVLGAYPEDSDVPFGLAYGFPAMQGERLWHHSHLLAVAPEWRGSGAAVALKLAQRERAVQQGLTRMTWTFDPLIARNARLNLGKLGARAVSYHPAWYDFGPGNPVPADRLMIEWDLTAPSQERPAPLPQGAEVLSAGRSGPGIPRLDSAEPRLLAEVPTDAEHLPDDLRLQWRLALRAALGEYLGRGYAVTGLARDGERAWYVLEGAETQPSSSG